jgi:glycosyltransferase involved in cell wall biosynthesis
MEAKVSLPERAMRLLVNDHAGHPFPMRLSRELARRGYTVRHTYCASVQQPRGDLRRCDTDPDSFSLRPLRLKKPFNRYGLVSRMAQEGELGRLLAGELERFAPDMVLSGNTPLGAQARLLSSARRQKAGFVFWLQDLLGQGIAQAVAEKLPCLGKAVGAYYIRLERRLLRKSQAVVAISEDFLPFLTQSKVTDGKISVIGNWSALDTIQSPGKDNPWSRMHGLAESFVFLYCGTCGLKHNANLMLELAEWYRHHPGVAVVVVSEGPGADALKAGKADRQLSNLQLFPFQPCERLAEVLAAGDVLVATLTPSANGFAVPSKVMTYLCAERPILLAAPRSNLAARIVQTARAGIVVGPDLDSGFVRAAERLRSNPSLRTSLAQNGRRYALSAFDIRTIADRFESIFCRCNPRPFRRQPD